MFFVSKDNIPEGVGFGTFSLPHIIWLVAIVIACVLAVAAVVIGLYFQLESIYRSLLMAPAAILIVIAFFFSTKVK